MKSQFVPGLLHEPELAVQLALALVDWVEVLTPNNLAKTPGAVLLGVTVTFPLLVSMLTWLAVIVTPLAAA
jgi:hypothetical protein